MATFKRVLKFIDVGGSTFSETYYSTNPSITDALQSGAGIYQARLALLATPNTLLKDVISNADVVRQTGRRDINLPGLLAVPIVNNAPDLAPPGAAMVTNLVGLTGGQRYLWMRGGVGTDYTLSGSGRPNPTPSWSQNLQAFLNALNLRGWGLRQLVSPAVNKPVAVSNVNGQLTPGQSVLTLSAPLAGVGAGVRVILGGFDKKVFPSLNGGFTVIAVGTTAGGLTTITVPYTTASNANIPALQGQARLGAYNVVSIVDPANSKFVYPGIRITRNPFTNSRGARRAQRIRRLA